MNPMKSIVTCCLLLLSLTFSFAQSKPLKVGVIGLTHTHVHWIFGSESRGDIEIVGIVETSIFKSYTNFKPALPDLHQVSSVF